MAYLFFWVIPVKKDGLDRYKARAAKFAPIWKEHGALSVTEALADNPIMGETTSFPRAVQLQDDEVCIVTTIRFPDKATHDKAIAAAQSDPRVADLPMDMVDGSRIVFASFVPFVDA